ncbi:MAG: 1-acyl-sn-glycerol-3-phosphate acyltransferase [Parcubacteria group bacterium]|nr:1-acyl-sn-glycerol-3-phosphate acyltransferase [Parcubacteria group bacterium]
MLFSSSLRTGWITFPLEWVLAALVYRKIRKPVWYVARDDYWWGTWWTKPIKNALATLLVDWRNPSAVLKEAERVLEQGGVVGMYPEGTRNTDARALALGKTGVARLALASSAPVIPVGYAGPSIATVWDVIREFAFKRNAATLSFGRAVDLSACYGKQVTRELLYRATDDIMAAIGALCGKRPRLHEYSG